MCRIYIRQACPESLPRVLSFLILVKLCIMTRFTRITAILAAASLGSAGKPILEERGVPANATGVTTITSPQGASIRFKQPGKAGVCETTPGVDDYAGYISLNEKTNMFFWFFEARENPSEKPLTLWLNGGPGSDSLIGLFQEHGPCNVTEDLKTELNPYSWNEHSNSTSHRWKKRCYLC
jgi:hypothetical protein